MNERIIYMNDPDGRKPARLSELQVENPRQLLDRSADLLCRDFVHADKSRLFFAQNITTHVAQILSIAKSKRPDIRTVYMSDHEISWIKDMLETPGYQPDAARSNYHENDLINSPTFKVKVFPFGEPSAAIANVNEPAIFFVSHVSRLTGEMVNMASLYRSIKEQNPDSILIVDGAQAIGAVGPIDIEGACDVYLGIMSKFLGAEPEIGLAFMSEEFFRRYIGDRNNYPSPDEEKLKKDIYSLFHSLENPLYQSDYQTRIKDLKTYATQRISPLGGEVLYISDNQAPNFLTLNFGSLEKTKGFVAFAASERIVASDNTGWGITESEIPLVRIGLSVRVTKSDIDRLAEVIQKYKR